MQYICRGLLTSILLDNFYHNLRYFSFVVTLQQYRHVVVEYNCEVAAILSSQELPHNAVVKSFPASQWDHTNSGENYPLDNTGLL